MKILIPNNFIEERTYIINTLIGDFLGLTFQLEIYEGQNYVIKINNKQLIFNDGFFSMQKDGNYLKRENIPLSIEYAKNLFTVEEDVPVLFGEGYTQTNSSQIVCGIDIFAGSFFMLTRWEEYVNNQRDLYNRFPAKASIAYNNNFLHRPIVNEYVEMLWNMLFYLKINQKRKKRTFDFILTHDVDRIAYWKGLKNVARTLGGDVIKRRNIPMFFSNLTELMKVKLGNQKDPFDTFDYLMDLSEAANIKSRFYFMSGGLTKYDNHYQINEALEIIQKVKERNHIIGFHPSFNAYNNASQWMHEKQILEEIAGVPISEGRQHYLRFEAPLTWNIWDDSGMHMDCTLGYADSEGFRCGTCYEFHVFDFLRKKKLQLLEYPLIVMESSFITYQSITPEDMKSRTLFLLNKTKKYNGNFVYLWHNSTFNVGSIKSYQSVYENILKTQFKHKGD